MGSRKECLKKALGITEYPWSSDEDEDSSDQRANTNSLEPQATTSQQRPTNEDQSKSVLYGTIVHGSTFYKPYLSRFAQGAESSGSNLRQTMNANQHTDCDLQPYNVNRSYRGTSQHNGSPSTSGYVCPRQSQGVESRRIPSDVQRLLSFKKVAREMLRQRNRASTSVVVPPRSRPINRIFAPPVPQIAGNVQGRGTIDARNVNSSNYNSPLFSFPDEPTSSSSNLAQSRSSNVKTEEIREPNGSADAVPSVDISFSDNDAEDAATTQTDRIDNHVIQENMEDSAVESSAATVTLEEGVIEIHEDLPTNRTDNTRDVNVDEDTNHEPNPSTSASHATTTEAQIVGVKRKKNASDQNEEIVSVKEFNQGLLRLLECPVCLEWMEPPISQCRRGHLVCGRCQVRLSACPVCRSLFSSVRNRAMEGVAEMLRYPCRHGCGREVKLRRRGPHEASCPARKYNCPALGCSLRMPLPYTELAHHFQTKHFPMLVNGKKHNFSMKVNAEQHDNWLIMAYDEMFHLKVDVDFPIWGIIVYVSYIGPKCKANNFMYEVRVDGQHHARKLVYTRVTHSDLENPSLNLNRQDCFHLNLDQALNFLRFKNRNCEPEKFLKVQVEISRSDLENTEGVNSDS